MKEKMQEYIQMFFVSAFHTSKAIDKAFRAGLVEDLESLYIKRDNMVEIFHDVRKAYHHIYCNVNFPFDTCVTCLPAAFKLEKEIEEYLKKLEEE